MNIRKGFFLLPGAFLCASVAMADTAPTSIFQFNGLAGNTLPAPGRPGSNGLTDPGGPFTCVYATGSDTCDNWNLLNGNGSTTGSAGHTVAAPVYVNGTGGNPLFKQGTKDIQDVSQWFYSPTQSAPPKDQMDAVYTAEYKGTVADGSDIVVVFGANRHTNNGSANIGIWYFQRKIKANADGTFSCGLAAGLPCHVDHDIFITSQFANGGSVPYVTAMEWDATGCATSGVVKPPYADSQDGQCVAPNLRLLKSETSTLCGTSIECANINSGTTNTSWAGALASPLFFEGAVDLSAALRLAGVSTAPCFSSFELETRASPDPNAELKQFVLGSFPTCSLTITKSCVGPTLPGSPIPTPSIVYDSNSKPYVHYDFNVTLTNDGGGTLFDPTVTDTFPVTGTTTGGSTINIKLADLTLASCASTSTSCTLKKILSGTSLESKKSVTITGSFEYPDLGSIKNSVTATAAAFQGQDPQSINKDSKGNPTTDSDIFGATSGGKNPSCYIAPNPGVTLTKSCVINLVPSSSGVFLQLSDTFTVCNNSSDYTTKISNINILNDVANGSTGTSIVSGLTLDANPKGGGQTCKTFSAPALITGKDVPGSDNKFTYTPKNCGNADINNTIDAITGVATPVGKGRCEFKDAAYFDGNPTDEFGANLKITQISPTIGQKTTATCHLCLDGFCEPPNTP